MGVLISHRRFVDYGRRDIYVAILSRGAKGAEKLGNVVRGKKQEKPRGRLINHAEFTAGVQAARLKKLRQQIIDNTPNF